MNVRALPPLVAKQFYLLLLATAAIATFASISFSPRAAFATSPPAVSESFDLLLIIIEFPDKLRPTDVRYREAGIDLLLPLTVANIEDVVFDNSTSTAARYSEMSNGYMTFTGDVIEVTLASEFTIADTVFDDWRAAADDEASNLGFDPASYDKVGYLVPYGFKNQLSEGGASGADDYFWASGVNSGNAYLREFVINHELGHTIGLIHADEIQSDGTIIPYEDQSDFMGLGNGTHTNAVNKYFKGWLDGARNTAHTVDASISHKIKPLANTASGLQVVTIDSHGSLPAAGVPVDTFISYRKAKNFDENLSLVATDPYGTLIRDTVHVHHMRKDGSLSRLLDRTLEKNDSYTICGTTITVTNITANEATVQIDQSAYNPVAPAVSVSAIDTDAVSSGTLVAYEVSVTNLDSTGWNCEAFYDSSYTTPGAGWIVNWDSSPKLISVAEGDTEFVQALNVVSPIGTPPGVYSFDLTLTNNGGSGSPVSTVVNVDYEVLAQPDTLPPTAPTGLSAAETFDSHVILFWTAGTDDTGIVANQVYNNGTRVLPDAGNVAAYVDFKVALGGSYEPGAVNGYYVVAMDAAGNLSPPSNTVYLDSTPPSTPMDLDADPSEGQVALSWSESSDNIGVTDYEIHRDGEWVATTALTWWIDLDVTGGASYEYTIFAWDGSLNVSSESSPVMAEVPAPAPPEPPIEPVPGLGWLGMAGLIAFILVVAFWKLGPSLPPG